jgi:hypothetical protein
MPMPASLRKLSQFPTVAALAADGDLQSWHNNVHVAVGGAMQNPNVSPCAAVFWPWHGFIDDIYQDWLVLQTLIIAAVPTPTGVYAVARDGRLLQFYFNPQGNWEVYDISALSGGVAGPITTAIPIITQTMNVFAVAADGRLLQFYFNPQTGGWEVYDISALSVS